MASDRWIGDRTPYPPPRCLSEKRSGESDEKGPAARRRPRAAREAYSLYVERAAEGANEADGPLSSLWALRSASSQTRMSISRYIVTDSRSRTGDSACRAPAAHVGLTTGDGRRRRGRAAARPPRSEGHRGRPRGCRAGRAAAVPA